MSSATSPASNPDRDLSKSAGEIVHYSTRHISAHNTMQKPCIHRNLTPRLLNNTHTPVGQFVFFACMSSGASLDERLCKSEIIEGTELCLGVCVRRWRPS